MRSSSSLKLRLYFEYKERHNTHYFTKQRLGSQNTEDGQKYFDTTQLNGWTSSSFWCQEFSTMSNDRNLNSTTGYTTKFKWKIKTKLRLFILRTKYRSSWIFEDSDFLHISLQRPWRGSRLHSQLLETGTDTGPTSRLTQPYTDVSHSCTAVQTENKPDFSSLTCNSRLYWPSCSLTSIGGTLH